MRIFDKDGTELTAPDLSLGRLEAGRLLIAHHPAVEPVEEKWHYEVVAQYSNGGKDIAKVVDVPRVEGEDAWDEFEDIHRYIPYTREELEEIRKAQEKARRNAPVPRCEMEAMAAKLDAVLQFQGLTVREASAGVYEVIKDIPKTGDYLTPIPWKPGNFVVAGLWYCMGDKKLPHEAIRNGVPASYYDKEYFDFVEEEING